MPGDLGNLDAVKVARAQAFGLLGSFFNAPVSTATLRSERGVALGYEHDAERLDENAPHSWRSIMRGRFRRKGHIRVPVALHRG